MQATQLKILALLAVCSLLSSQLFGQANVSSQRKSASKNTGPFIKLVKSTGHLIQTIQDVRGGFVSISYQGSEDFLLRRVRTSGEPTWERILQFHSDSFVDRVGLSAISETTDGGSIVVGYALNCSTRYCDIGDDYIYAAIAVKLHPDGAIQWKKRFTMSSGSMEFSSVFSLPDGGFVAGGTATVAHGRAVFVGRFSSTGDIIWTKSFRSLDDTFQLLATPDNGFILVGIANNGGAEVIKLNHSGNVVWGKSFKAKDPRFIIQGAIVTSDRGIVLAGVCGQECDQLFLIRLDLNGEITWKIAWKGEYALPVFFGPVISDFTQTPDGGYAVTGQIIPVKGMDLNSFLLKIDPSLHVVFQKNYRKREELSGFLFASGSGYLIFGRSGKDTLISKVNSQGVVPGCSSFYSVPTERIALGELTTKPFNVREPVSLALGTNDIAATSEASNHSTSTVCQ